MRDRAPQLIQPPNQPSTGLMPMWALGLVLLVLIGGGLGGWLYLNRPPSSSLQANLQPSATPLAHASVTPLHRTPTPAPTRATTPTLPPPTVTPTQTLRYAVVTRGLNIREQPSAKARLLGSLAAGAVITLVGQPTKAEGYTWYHLQPGGWVVSGSLIFYPTLDAAKKAKP